MLPSTAPPGTASEPREQRQLSRAPSWAVIAFTASLVVAVPLSLFAVEHVGATVVVAVTGAMTCTVTARTRFRTRVSAARALVEGAIGVRTGDWFGPLRR